MKYRCANIYSHQPTPHDCIGPWHRKRDGHNCVLFLQYELSKQKKKKKQPLDGTLGNYAPCLVSGFSFNWLCPNHLSFIVFFVCMLRYPATIWTLILILMTTLFYIPHLAYTYLHIYFLGMSSNIGLSLTIYFQNGPVV